MTVVNMPTPINPPWVDTEWLMVADQRLPPVLAALLPALPNDGQWEAEGGVPELARLGVPLGTIEQALLWQPGAIARWAALPRAPQWDRCAALWAQRCYQAAAEAEAELAAALHRRGRQDARTAQWLLERRRPERWGASSADIAQAVARVVSAVGRELPDVDQDRLRAALTAAAEGG